MCSTCREGYHETDEGSFNRDHGCFYEREMSKFILKRVFDQDYPDFQLTRERKRLGKFDDLALIYEDEGEKKCVLFQFKHVEKLPGMKICREDLSVDPNSYYFLQKYFHHYLHSLEKMKTDDDLKDVRLENLFLCTNLDVESFLGGIGSLTKRKNKKILKGLGSTYELHLSDEEKKLVFEESFMSDRERLAKELVTCLLLEKRLDVKQLHDGDRVNLIKRYHVPLGKHVIDMRQRKFARKFLESQHKDDNVRGLCEDIKRYLRKLFDYCKYLQEGPSTKCPPFRKNSPENKILNHINASLPTYEWFESYVTDKFFIPIGAFGSEIAFPQAPKTFQFNAVDEAEMGRKIDSFLGLLLFGVEMEMDHIKVIDAKIGPEKNRKWIGKKDLISKAMETEIVFQGERVILGELLRGNPQLLTPTIVSHVFYSKDPISVGERLEGLSHCYIPRTLKQRRKLSINKLSEIKDISVITNVDESEVMLLMDRLPPHIVEKCVILKSVAKVQRGKYYFVNKECDVDFFDDFVNSNRNIFRDRTVHWFRYEKTHLVLEGSFGSLEMQEDSFGYLEMQEGSFGSLERLEDYLEEDTFEESTLKNGGRHLVFSCEPGMGKTVLLHHYGEMIKKDERNKDNWVVFIPFNDCYDHVDIMEEFNTEEQVLDFVAHFACTNDLSKEFLKVFLKERRLILLIDDYDDLSRDGLGWGQKCNIQSLFWLLKSPNLVKQFCVSTTPRFKESVERYLCSPSISLEEISEEEQIRLLVDHWIMASATEEERERIRKHDPNFLVTREYTKRRRELSEKGKKLVREFNVKLSYGQEKTFLGVPLHVSMVAEIFEKDIGTVGSSRPYFSNVAELYERFMETKYTKYLDKVGMKEGRDTWKDMCNSAHQNLAIINYRSIIGNYYWDRIPTVETGITFEELCGVGIIYKKPNYNFVHRTSDEEQNYNFVHRTYAEYFVSKRLLQLDPNVNKDLLKRILRGLEKEFVLYLFDCMVTKGTPLRFTMEGNEDEVRKLRDLEQTDPLLRGHLYYSLKYEHPNVSNILLEKGANIDFTCNFFYHALRDESLKFHTFIIKELFKLKSLKERCDVLSEMNDLMKRSLGSTLETPYKCWFVVRLFIEERWCYRFDLEPLLNRVRGENPSRVVEILLEELTEKTYLPVGNMDKLLVEKYFVDTLCTLDLNEGRLSIQECNDRIVDLFRRFTTVTDRFREKFKLFGLPYDLLKMEPITRAEMMIEERFDLQETPRQDSLSSLIRTIREIAKEFGKGLESKFKDNYLGSLWTYELTPDFNFSEWMNAHVCDMIPLYSNNPDRLLQELKNVYKDCLRKRTLKETDFDEIFEDFKGKCSDGADESEELKSILSAFVRSEVGFAKRFIFEKVDRYYSVDFLEHFYSYLKSNDYFMVESDIIWHRITKKIDFEFGMNTYRVWFE